MARTRANGIEIEYQLSGDEGAAPLLMVMGFGVQLIQWPEAFCVALAGRGFRLIRFDNRDVGLSQKMSGGYRLEDMAADAAGLLDALGIASAHVVGASMGGFIAQLMAIHHAARVRTLCSMMSSTGARGVGQPSPELLPLLMTPPPADRDGYLASRLAAARLVAGSGFAFDEERIRDQIGRAWDRAYYPAGIARQLQAVLTARDRSEALATLRVPTVIIHGSEDRIVDYSGGEATARAIPGARLVTVPGMGHDLPSGAWPILIDAIVQNAARG